jgi:hypothetical protein
MKKMLRMEVMLWQLNHLADSLISIYNFRVLFRKALFLKQLILFIFSLFWLQSVVRERKITFSYR